MNIRDKNYSDSLTQALSDPAEAAAYLDAVIELDDKAALLVALRYVVKANSKKMIVPEAKWRE